MTQKQIQYGKTVHPAGMTIEVMSKWQEWTDYAGDALSAHRAFLDLLAACEAMPFAQRPHAQINAVKQILDR